MACIDGLQGYRKRLGQSKTAKTGSSRNSN
jgi:hypothetical protein